MIEVVKQTPKRSIASRLGSVVDGIVYMFNPDAGIRRMALRSMWDSGEQARMSGYEGGNSSTTRDGKWLGSRLSEDSEQEESLVQQRSRSRELYRNDSMGGVVDARTNIVVSYGFTPRAGIKERVGMITEDQARRWNTELEEVYEQVHLTICQTGKFSLWELTELIEQCHGYAGESITIMGDRGDTDSPIPLKLEVVDSERLETPFSMTGNKLVRMGVEYDASGAIVAYHIRDSHPFDTLDIKQTWTRYPAERVMHVFKRMFPGQTRGLPWMVRVLNRVKDAKDLDEATIIAQQVQACFAAFVTTPLDPMKAANAAAVDVNRTEEIRPAMLRYLSEGQEITFSNPSNGGANYEPFQDVNKHNIAIGLNFPFEMVAKDWRGLSFAAGRLSLADARTFAKTCQKRNTEKWLCKIWQRMVFESVLAGACTIPVREFNANRWLYYRHSWTPPQWAYVITPGEEIKAAKDAVDNNFRTKASVVGEFGDDLEDVFAERKKERQMERDMDIEPLTTEEFPPPEPSPQDKEMAEA